MTEGIGYWMPPPHFRVEIKETMACANNTVRQNLRKMKSYICILFAFVTLIASGQSITCSECWPVGDTECCNGKTRECPSGLCMTISEYCNLDGKEYQTIRKTCGDPMFCDISFYVTTEKGIYVEACAKCCTEDNCNADLNYTRTSPGEPNGYVCPACYRNDTVESCDPGNHTVQCRGTQTKCMNYCGIPQFSDGDMYPVSLQGCTIPGACDLGFVALPGAKEKLRGKMECTPATKPV